jgi:hypothetical protein
MKAFRDDIDDGENYLHIITGKPGNEKNIYNYTIAGFLIAQTFLLKVLSP